MTFIYSKFATDESWQELISEMVSEIPNRLATLDTAVASKDVEVLRYLIHQLKGACGSYGFDEVTPLARQLEIALEQHQEVTDCRKELEEFRSALASMTDQPSPTHSL